jgi:hypothetical protein
MIARAKTAIEQNNLCAEFVPYEGEWNYDWCVQNWGSKWDINEGQVCDQIDDTLDCVFETAWSPPIKLFEALERLGFEVEAQYFEPGAAYVGEYSNGVDEDFDIDPEDFSNIPDYLMEMFDIPEHYEFDDE